MRLACCQFDVAYGNPAKNAEKAVQALESLALEGVDLAIFPEAFLTGYCVESRGEAWEIAIPRDHGAVECLQECSDRIGIGVVAGFAERGVEGLLYNSALLCEPTCPTRFYRKSHLPELGLDKHVAAGDELPVFETRWGKIGILICFDQRPPEPTRVLSLNGAQLICLPTNWPVGAENSAEIICIARASENRVFYATCNRVGDENGFEFIGRSKIIDVRGQMLASANADEQVLIADLNLTDADNKRTVNIPGKYELTVFESRRPELYRDLSAPQRSS